MTSTDAWDFYGVNVGWQHAGLRLSESVYPAHLRMPSHSHERAYLGFVLSGGYRERSGRQVRDRKALTGVFHPEGESHSVAFSSGPARIFRVELSEEWLDRLHGFARAPRWPSEFAGRALCELVLRLRSEFKKADRWSALGIEGLSLELLAEVCRTSTSDSETGVPNWLKDAREMLASRFTEALTLQDVATAVGVHPVHLAREFRRRFHCTTGDFVRRTRVEFACRRISESESPLSDIALAAGFYDQSHFTNTFRRLTGMTPAAYRDAVRPG
jgi:AraC family transcriptional regulator